MTHVCDVKDAKGILINAVGTSNKSWRHSNESPIQSHSMGLKWIFEASLFSLSQVTPD